MGLGKTIQAIGTAVLKKQVFGFRKVLVVCPASLKNQ
jgi:SNF2 family DNA or RNA helicase